jgi:predicted O-linked N-acetylglucosamine transferase (SPINDLY family)
LSQVGLTELAAHDADEYVTIAKGLAGDLDRLREIRAGLRDRMAASPLLDGAAFAREFETALREMWRASYASGN